MRSSLFVAMTMSAACTFPKVFPPGTVQDVVRDSDLGELTDNGRMDAPTDTVDSGMDATLDATLDATVDASTAEIAVDSASDVLSDVAADTSRDAMDAGPGCALGSDAGAAPSFAWAAQWGSGGPTAFVGGLTGEFGDITTDASGNVYVLSTYNGGTSVGAMLYAGSRYGALVIKYDPAGVRQWIKHFSTEPAMGAGDFLASELFWDEPTNQIVVLAKGSGGAGARIDGLVVGAGALTDCPAIVRLNAMSGELNRADIFSTASGWAARTFVRTGASRLLIAGSITGATTLPGGRMAMPAGGARDTLVVEWDFAMNAVVNHWVIGSAADEDPTTVATLPGGDILIGGKMNSPAITRIDGIAIPASNGFNAFVARFNRAGMTTAYRLLEGMPESIVQRIAVGPSGDYYVAGVYNGQLNYGDAMFEVAGAGNGAFVARVNAANNAPRWLVGQTGNGAGYFGLRRIEFDGCEDIHTVFTARATNDLARFAGVSLAAGAMANPASFAVVLRGSDGTAARLVQLSSATGAFVTQAFVRLSNGRYVLKGNVSGNITVAGQSFAVPLNNIAQFAGALQL